MLRYFLSSLYLNKGGILAVARRQSMVLTEMRQLVVQGTLPESREPNVPPPQKLNLQKYLDFFFYAILDTQQQRDRYHYQYGYRTKQK